MRLPPSSMVDWPMAVRRYFAASIVFHLVWEILQLPLYTIWTEPLRKQAFALLHCTIGDLMIAGLSLLASLAVVGKEDWPRAGSRTVWLLLVLFGTVYAVYSEWLNVSVRGSWAYAPAMPTLPILGTGLAPLLQWIIVPTLVLRVAGGRWPWADANARSS